jgi:hypothetical protein
MNGSSIAIGKGRPIKTIKKGLEVNGLDKNMTYYRTLWRVWSMEPTPPSEIRLRVCCDQPWLLKI